MVTINLAYTAPINPAGATPALTEAQVWAGLRRKVRRAQEFVPVIEACEVVSSSSPSSPPSNPSSQPSSSSSSPAEKGGDYTKVVRLVRFAAGQGPKGAGKKGEEGKGEDVKETCLLHAPCRVDFLQEDGSTVSNVVSRGSDGGLWMTYAFEWRHPDVEEEGGEEAEGLRERHWKTAEMAVNGSIDTIRRLVREGEI